MCRINGLTHINLTKLDCLDALDTIQLGVAYKLHGQTIHSVPSDLPSLEQVNPDESSFPVFERPFDVL